MYDEGQTREFNDKVTQWGFRTRSLLKNSIASLSMKGKGDLVRSRHNESPGMILRKPKPWFTPVFEREIPKLADMITRIKADSILDPHTYNLRT